MFAAREGNMKALKVLLAHEKIQGVKYIYDPTEWCAYIRSWNRLF